MYELLKVRVTNALEPLKDYLKAFDIYLPILRSNPDDYCRDIEMEEN